MYNKHAAFYVVADAGTALDSINQLMVFKSSPINVEG